VSTPDRAAWRAFGARLAGAAGVASLGAGAIFFVAANWQRLGAFGRFTLLEAAFAACAAVAWWRPPPDRAGRSALALASLLVGALLALYGQSYQTGADLYELFVAWAVLMLPFAFAARSAAVWAIWWGVANVAMGLALGWLGPGHELWRWIDPWGVGKPVMLLVPCAIDLAGAALYARLRETPSASAEPAPRWLARLLATVAFAYGTAACSLAIFHGRSWAAADPHGGGQESIVLAAFAVASVAVALATLRARRDAFPMALVMASWIAIGTLLLVTFTRFDSIGGFMLVALWLIAASSGAGYALTRWVRAWRSDEDDRPASAAEGGRPWYVSLLLGGAGWLGALFLLLFVLAAIFSTGESVAKAVVAGAALVAAAAALYRAARGGAFTGQLALALSIAGQSLLLLAVVNGLDPMNHAGQVAPLALAAALLQLAMVAIMPSTVHRGMSTLFACMAWAVFVRYGLWDDAAMPRRDLRPIAAPGLALAGWLVTWLPVAGLLALVVSRAPAWRGTARASIAQPVAAGLVASLAVATLLSEPLEAIAFLASPGAVHEAVAWWPFLSAIAALGALAAAFALGSRGLMALSIAAALLHLAHFYYAMGTPLLVKSAIMIAIGCALVAAGRRSRRRAA
jgi:hypothetical protein